MATTDLTLTTQVLAWRGNPQPVSACALIAKEQWDTRHAPRREANDRAIHIVIDGASITVPGGTESKLVEQILRMVRAVPGSILDP